MTTATQNQSMQARSSARFIPALFAAIFGLAVISITGHVQAAALHDAAHDVRHATGFPCH
jgi:cobalt transporter subunit CbtB